MAPFNASLGANMQVTDKPRIEPLAHSPDGAAQRLGISTRSVYVLIAAGQLRSLKVGKRRLITDTELQGFLSRKMAEAA